MLVSIFRMSANRCLTLLVMAGLLQAAVCGFAQEKSPLVEGIIFKTPVVPADLHPTLRTVHEQLSRNVPPADNMVVTLVQLFGRSVFEIELRTASLDLLGIDHLSESAPQMIYVEKFLRSRGSIETKDLPLRIAQLEDQIVTAGELPWAKADLPDLFDYLEANREALDLVVAATQQPHYYAPFLSIEEPPRLLSASLVIERRLPFLARLLSARAMLRASEGHVDDFLNDLRACQRMALLLAVGSPFDVSQAKAHIIDAIAFRTLVTLLSQGKFSTKIARKYLQKQAEIPRLPLSSTAADVGERAVLHQEIDLLQSDPLAIEQFFETEGQKPALPGAKDRWSKIRWELAHKRADHIQDRVVKSLSILDRKEQYQQFEQMDRDFKNWESTVDQKTQQFAESTDAEMGPASEWIGETMAWSLRPWYWQRRLTDDRARTRRDLLTLTAALQVYRADKGEFPEKLEHLSPQYIPASLPDAQTDEPYHYHRPTPGSAQLISWGPNRMNDAGQRYNDDQIIELQD